MAVLGDYCGQYPYGQPPLGTHSTLSTVSMRGTFGIPEVYLEVT